MARRRAVAPVTAAALFEGMLTRGGWREVTDPEDRYAAAAGVHTFEPVRARRAGGHTPARVVITGTVVDLHTFGGDGAPFERVTWTWVTPGNLYRVHAYIAEAMADAVAVRGTR